MAKEAQAEIQAECDAKLQGMIVGLETAFGDSRLPPAFWSPAPTASPAPAGSDLKKLNAWKLEPSYAQECTEFAMRKSLVNFHHEVVFITSLHNVISHACACIDMYSPDDWDQRMLTMDRAKVISGFHKHLFDFERFRGTAPLSALFVQPTEISISGVYIKGLAGKWDAAALAEAATKQGRALLNDFAAIWMQDMNTMSSRMAEWIPEGWQLKRDEVINDEVVKKAMLTNSNVKMFVCFFFWGGGLSGITWSVNEAVQWLHKHAPGKQKLVEVAVLKKSEDMVLSRTCSEVWWQKKSEDMVRDAADTVATSFMVYQLVSVISYEPNVNVRSQKVDTLKKQLGEKNVPIGKDTLAFMEDLRSNKFQVLKREKAE